MRRALLLLPMLLGLAAQTPAAAQMPAGVPVSGAGITGTLLRHAAFPSAHVASRHVDVWLPPGYDAAAGRRYPVVYMHDGQNLFDPAASYIGVDWGVDEALTDLIAVGAAEPAIVVGVWNTPARFAEYMPQRAVVGHDTVRSGTGRAAAPEALRSDAYLRFLVAELKPFIDTRYRTRPGRASTFVMGSSMGGLISLYAITQYPRVFGGAGCVSTHWPAGNGVVVDFLPAALPDPATHRLYFDYGTETLDAQYEPYQQRVDAILHARGYRMGRTWVTRRFAGADHSERAWRARVHLPLLFFLGARR